MGHNVLYRRLDRSHVHTVRYCLQLSSTLHIHISCNDLPPTKTVTPVTTQVGPAPGHCDATFHNYSESEHKSQKESTKRPTGIMRLPPESALSTGNSGEGFEVPYVHNFSKIDAVQFSSNLPVFRRSVLPPYSRRRLIRITGNFLPH